MIIGAYQGPPYPKPADSGIAWFTDSDIYHISVIDYDVINGQLVGSGQEWEAKPFIGVAHNDHWGQNAGKGSVIQLLDFKVPLTDAERTSGLAFLNGEIGCGYDYIGIAGFIVRSSFRRDYSHPSKWFCSEYGFAWCLKSNRTPLNNRQPYEVPPLGLWESPIFNNPGKLVVGAGDAIQSNDDPQPPTLPHRDGPGFLLTLGNTLKMA